MYLLPLYLVLFTGRHYKSGEFEDAVDYYTMALHYCPENDESQKDRAIYLANRAQAHLRLEEVSMAAKSNNLLYRYNQLLENCTCLFRHRILGIRVGFFLTALRG